MSEGLASFSQAACGRAQCHVLVNKCAAFQPFRLEGYSRVEPADKSSADSSVGDKNPTASS